MPTLSDDFNLLQEDIGEEAHRALVRDIIEMHDRLDVALTEWATEEDGAYVLNRMQEVLPVLGDTGPGQGPDDTDLVSLVNIAALYWTARVILHGGMHIALAMAPAYLAETIIPLPPHTDPGPYCLHIADAIKFFSSSSSSCIPEPSDDEITAAKKQNKATARQTIALSAIPFPAGIALKYLVCAKTIGSNAAAGLTQAQQFGAMPITTLALHKIMACLAEQGQTVGGFLTASISQVVWPSTAFGNTEVKARSETTSAMSTENMMATPPKSPAASVTTDPLQISTSTSPALPDTWSTLYP
jgi:hypothetical protein